jgi:predicted Zn-dependent protease
LNFISLALQDGVARPAIMPVLLYSGHGADRIDAGCTGEAIALFEGMVRFLSNDDDLAFVIAHEMAHCFNGRASWAPSATRVPGASPIPFSGYSPSQEHQADAHALAYMYEAGFDMDAGVETLVRLTTEVPKSLAGSYFRLHPHSLERVAHAKESEAAVRSRFHPLTKQALHTPAQKVTFAMTSWVNLDRVAKESRWIQQFEADMRAFEKVRLSEIKMSKRHLQLAEQRGDHSAIEKTRKESEALIKKLQEEIAAKQTEILLQTSLPFHRAIVQVTREGLQGDPNARLAEVLDRKYLQSP